MRYLFVHQNFPGQFLHLVRRLVQEGGHDIVFITEPNANVIPGVRKVVYRVAARVAAGSMEAVEFDGAMARAAAVAEVAVHLFALGFVPDIVIGHHGWGELLNLADVWPGVSLLGYYEFFYRTEGLDVGFDPEFPLDKAARARVRAKNAVNLLALSNPGHGQTPTLFQHGTYPDWARRRISVLAEGVDLATCRPEPAIRSRRLTIGAMTVEPGEALITYVARDLEPYRGFHVLMRALPAILRRRPDAKAVLVGGDGVSYGAKLEGGSWREALLAEVGGLDPGRVSFPGKVDYGSFVSLLQRSDAHVYLTYPFVASWSLREALACGCAIVASDTAPVLEFIDDGVNGVLTSCLDPSALTERVLALLDEPVRAQSLRAGARAFAERYLGMEAYLGHYRALIDEVVAHGRAD